MRFLELLICCDKKIMTKTSGSLATSGIVCNNSLTSTITFTVKVSRETVCDDELRCLVN